jgi:3-methyladenine DNA glycosylase AlkD
MQSLASIMQLLQNTADPARIEGMKKFAIGNNNMLGVSMPQVRAIAKQVGKNNAMALALWDTQIHEAKILATLLAEPKLFTEANCDAWIHAFDAWDVCDQACSNLFTKLPFIEQKIMQYHSHSSEFVKRFAFAQIAYCAVHWKKKEDDYFLQFLPFIIQQSTDSRNFVRKAINWALRSIGKRSLYLNDFAIATCETLLESNNKTATWIANDTLKELTSTAKQDRLMLLQKRKNESRN